MDVSPDLIRAAQRGDREAMEDLIKRSYRPAYTLALRLLGNPDDAADATQEAYVRMSRSLKRFREVGAFPTWLFRIVSNVCLTELRKRSRRELVTDDEAMQQVPDTTDVEQAAVDRAFVGDVERCMSRLPDAYRAVLVLRDVYDMSGDEVADLLGITAGAVKVRLHRARRRLRDEILAEHPDWATDPDRPEEKASA